MNGIKKKKVSLMSKLKKKKISSMDIVAFLVLTLGGIIVLFPFWNMIVISFTTQKEYMETPLLIFPKNPVLEAYQALVGDGRIWIGFRTTFLYLLLGVPLNLFLTTSLAYGLSRKDYPGSKLIRALILFTMLFGGGIIPLYLVMKSMHLTNTIWAVILAYGVNTFNAILMSKFFASLPESLLESAKLDGAGDWKMLYYIIIPLSKPIFATITLFYTVDRWNEWYNSMIFVRKNSLQPLQLVLRSIVIDSQVQAKIASMGVVSIEQYAFDMAVKMAAVVVTIIPVMCVFPFLQKHFVKGVMIGAVKE
ncbi:MAG: carbohydrate ABC transporter permease [Lachnospiraceae bacterium]|nr:carbohydrate ABC transporter permease [Lachnospiraceae bacterium]